MKIECRWYKYRRNSAHGTKFLPRWMPAYLGILVLLGQVLSTDPLIAESGAAKSRLAGTRAQFHQNYSAVGFDFTGPFDFETPFIHENEVICNHKNVDTYLKSGSAYGVLPTSATLKPAGDPLITVNRRDLIGNTARLGQGEIEQQTSSKYSGGEEEYFAEETNSPNIDKTEFNSSESRERTTQIMAPGLRKALKKKIVEKNDITMNFHQKDIQEILSAMAIQQEVNIVSGSDINGDVSIHLYKVSFNNALKAICQAGGFTFTKQGGVYYVYTPVKKIDFLAPETEMRIIKIQYADMDKIQDVVGGIPGMRLVKIHEPSKTVIVEDTPENIAKIETLIQFWDTPPKQVLIEAKILEITLTDDMALGVNWEQFLGDARIGTGGFSTANIPVDGSVSPIPDTGKGIFGNIITGSGTKYQFTAAIDALQTKTKVDTLSTPKILAIHSKAARVQVGGQQGYRVTTTVDNVTTTSIEFIDTGTILEITPYIDNEDNVLLRVEPTINSARIEEGGIPVVNSTMATTWLMAKNMETVFIGGLIQQTDTTTHSGVPCLGSMPVLGPAFSGSTKDKGKSELIILITPRVIKNETPASDEAILKTKRKEEELNDREFKD